MTRWTGVFRSRRLTAPLTAGALLMAVAALVAAPLAAQASDDPTAVVVRVSGNVKVQRASGGAPVDAAVGMHLDDGDRVVVGEGGRAVLLHASGRMEAATSTVTVERPAGSQPAGVFSSTVNTLVAVATTDAGRQLNRQGMIRPIPGEPVAVTPRNGVTVLEPRPLLTWFASPDAESYMLQLRRVDGVCGDPSTEGSQRPSYCMPKRFTAGADTTWHYPASEPPLVPGATYEWAVGAQGSGRRVSQPVRFKVIDGAAYSALAEALAGIAATGLDPASEGLFLSAVAYRNAGLLYEADALLRRLAADGASGVIFHTLRGEVLDTLGRIEEAEREFRLAGVEVAP